MVCVDCYAEISATIVQAKSHGWTVWVGGSRCQSCQQKDVPGIHGPVDGTDGDSTALPQVVGLMEALKAALESQKPKTEPVAVTESKKDPR